MSDPEPPPAVSGLLHRLAAQALGIGRPVRAVARLPFFPAPAWRAEVADPAMPTPTGTGEAAMATPPDRLREEQPEPAAVLGLVASEPAPAGPAPVLPPPVGPPAAQQEDVPRLAPRPPLAMPPREPEALVPLPSPPPAATAAGGPPSVVPEGGERRPADDEPHAPVVVAAPPPRARWRVSLPAPTAAVEATGALSPPLPEPPEPPEPPELLLPPQARPAPLALVARGGAAPPTRGRGEERAAGAARVEEITEVYVSIGRVEVSAFAPAPPQPQPRRSHERAGMSLDEYLARRQAGRQ